MSARHFYLPSAKNRVAEAVARIERGTSAEVMVAVRPASGHYRHTDYLVGFGLVMAGLLVFLFHPAPFRDDLFPFEALALFVMGALVSANVPDVRRLFTARSLMDGSVRTAARAALVELGTTRTRDRTGLLVFVSLFERRVEVVADVGLEVILEDPLLAAADSALERSLHPPDLGAFVAALETLGPLLAAHAPRGADDKDELPNVMHVS